MAEIFDKDELRKSLAELDFTETEIDEIITKAEEEGKFGGEEGGKPAFKKQKKQSEKAPKSRMEGKEEPDGDEPEGGEKEPEGSEGGEEGGEPVEDDETIDEKSMKKAFDKVVGMKNDLDKAMTDFMNKFGSAPGVKTPDTTLGKSMGNDIEKAFSGKFNEIDAALKGQKTTNETILKSLELIGKNVQAIAESPSPFKGIHGSYKFLEKGEKTGEDGNAVVSLRNKDRVIEVFEKSLEKIEDESDRKIVSDMISDFTVVNKVNPSGLAIVRKTMNVDFEK